MKKTLIYIAAIAALSVSSFSFAKSSDDKVNELAFIVTCGVVYDQLGLETKFLEQVKNHVNMSDGMKNRDKEEAKARATLVLYANSKRDALNEVKDVCDSELY